MDVREVKCKWNRLATIPLSQPLCEALPPSEFNQLVAEAREARHPCFQLNESLFVEVPPPTWGRGDYLVYLPQRFLLIRKNYRDSWYIDIGIFRPIAENLYGWTDLWLDVTTPDPASRYEVLDVDEFADALRRGRVCMDNAILALDSLHQLLQSLRSSTHSIRDMFPELVLAEDFLSQMPLADGSAQET